MTIKEANNSRKNNKTVIFIYLLITTIFIILNVYIFKDKLSSNILNPNKKIRKISNKNTFLINNIVFDSNFDSGSLEKIDYFGDSYYVKLFSDPHNYKYKNKYRDRNWFFFSIENNDNFEKNMSLIFSNMKHNYSMFKNGISPVFNSTYHNNPDYYYWNRSNVILKLKKRKIIMSLKFTLGVNEKIYIALSFPYTYSRYINFIKKAAKIAKENKNIYFKTKNIINSLSNKKVKIIYLTHKNNIIKDKYYPKFKNLFNSVAPNINKFNANCKIILSARVHPSETISSFMIENIINILISKKKNIELLLKKCLFIIFPMLNPDGVYYGLTRTDTKGINLNDVYNLSDLTTPSIYALKRIVRYEKNVKYFIDFHSHFTKRGIFLFGNPLKKSNYNSVLYFPLIYGKLIGNYKKLLRNSKFGSGKSAVTSRKYFLKYLKINNIYTFEINYWGQLISIKKLINNSLIIKNKRIIKQNEITTYYTINDFNNYSYKVIKALYYIIVKKLEITQLKEYGEYFYNSTTNKNS